MRGNGQHGRHASVGIEESIDEVQIARAATSRANRQLAGELRFSSGRKGRRLFVADVNPLGLAAAMKSVGHRLRLSPTSPYIRCTPAWASVSTSCSATVLDMVGPAGR